MTREELHARCKAEGLSIMQDVFDIILDREEVTLDQIEAFLNDDRDTFSCYENYIVQGINNLSDDIQVAS